MYVQVNISLNSNESATDLSGNAAELAQAILTAVGGDPEKDVVNVQIMDSGTAGQVAPLPEQPTP